MVATPSSSSWHNDGLRRPIEFLRTDAFSGGSRLRGELMRNDQPRQFNLLSLVLVVGGSEYAIEKTVNDLTCRRSHLLWLVREIHIHPLVGFCGKDL